MVAKMYTLIRFITHILTILSVLLTIKAAPAPPPPILQPRAFGQGWTQMEKLFVLLISLTAVHPTLPPASIGSTVPNPRPTTLSATPMTATPPNGPNFITYLTTTFNASKLLTYNFAGVGANVDEHAINNDPKDPPVDNDLVQQVMNGFRPSYTDHLPTGPKAQWSGDSSLFVSSFGVSDIMDFYQKGEYESIIDSTFKDLRSHAKHPLRPRRPCGASMGTYFWINSFAIRRGACMGCWEGKVSETLRGGVMTGRTIRISVMEINAAVGACTAVVDTAAVDGTTALGATLLSPVTARLMKTTMLWMQSVDVLNLATAVAYTVYDLSGVRRSIPRMSAIDPL
ncbi:MAG: hypothetical protein Q9166_007150 [cf. Caloplaca sp. 2 TL-2023]